VAAFAELSLNPLGHLTLYVLPERLELPTPSSVVKCSDPLNYRSVFNMAGKLGVEPSTLVFQTIVLPM